MIFHNLNNNNEGNTNTHFIFINTSNNALTLLQKSTIPETKNYGNFPMSNSFLMTENPQITVRHITKTYNITPTNTPPMSMPHLDTRILNDKHMILFNPFTTFSTKYLKQNSY